MKKLPPGKKRNGHDPNQIEFGIIWQPHESVPVAGWGCSPPCRRQALSCPARELQFGGSDYESADA